jgi:hypothetical protein
MRDLRTLPHSNGEVSLSYSNDGVMSSSLGGAHDPSARGYAGTSPFEWGGMHVAPPSLRRWGRKAGAEAHDHIDHIRGHIDHTDVTDDDHMKTARAATPKYLSRLIFARVRASGRSHRSHRSHGFSFCRPPFGISRGTGGSAIVPGMSN